MIKITEKDIECFNQNGWLAIHCDSLQVPFDQLKQQILSNQDKAEKLDEERIVFHEQIRQLNKTLDEVEKENKRLKEIVERLDLEYNKLIKLKKQYGLQQCGESQLHLANFCMTGKLEPQYKTIDGD